MAKEPASDQQGTNSPNGAVKKKRRKPQRCFPVVTLEEALKIPQAIRQKNEGHPFDTNLVAKACGLSRTNPKFFYLTSAFRDYGLTSGTRYVAKIELTELGRQLVYAGTPDVEKQKKVEAFFNVEKFKQVYDYYNGSNLPEEQYLHNILENEFKIPPAQHAEFVEVFKANCKYLEIETGLKGVSSANVNGSTKAIDLRVLGQPQGKFDKTAFVIMPFTEKGTPPRPKGFFDEVLKSLITPAGNAAGFGVITARREDTDIIHHTIINQLLNAELVIADLTDHNPNVLFELGIRLAKEKLVVLIKSKDTGAIFDVDSMMRVFSYDQNLWSTTVEADVKGLIERINGTWERRETAVNYMQILTTAPHQTAKA